MDYWIGEIKPISGKYTIFDNLGQSYKVFCDFDSEQGMAWTLFESFDQEHEQNLTKKPFTADYPKNERDPNWKLFRLPKHVMSSIASSSTYWRATCSYPVYGVDFRDYIRVNLSILNPLTYKSDENKTCVTVDYVDIKGTNCVKCTQAFFQPDDKKLSLSPKQSRTRYHCNFDTSKVEHKCYSTRHARLYGRSDYCPDPKHRCSETPTSTTEFWFGAVRAKNERKNEGNF